ncbi:acetoacetate decarboxylase family protein [Oceanicoccus sp. KOV_DT_Chl]|uniref:acetoacetate decarboxylase family protein n=1 Tax=Oceanicoccus sp. KOV_DT_Chl TaxID=1904639 RepID=UPI000C7DC822|nr:acetoacetate decarboxylase family protein [Oceanicoccus sp. KOV_DT_Chl]
MTDTYRGPLTSPGELAQWPMLKIVYRTDPDKIAKLLPPGIEVSETANVNLTIYNLPVKEEPEYGILITVDATYDGIAGEYAMGYGIDQEAAIFISLLKDGQPKFPCETTYYRLGDKVTARCSHQGYTFVEFEGLSAEEDLLDDGGLERHEWWVKVSRQVGGEQGYDFPPHVVHVHGKYGPGYRLAVNGKLTLRESPWDPIAELLPMREQISAHLWWPEYRSRDVTLSGALDPDKYWPFIDTISGSKWPGYLGGPIPKKD